MKCIDSHLKLSPTNDGYIRLTKKFFGKINMRHLVSGIYMASRKLQNKVDMIDQIEGFTEWVSDTKPAVSLGWDWKLDVTENPPLYRRCGLPYSNIMLTDNSKANLDMNETERLITSTVDQLGWEKEVYDFISKTYGYNVDCQY